MNLLVDIGNSHLALGYIYLLDRGSTPWCKKNFNSIKYDFLKEKKQDENFNLWHLLHDDWFLALGQTPIGFLCKFES